MKYRVLQCILQVQQNIRERGVLTDSDMKENLRIPVGPQEGLERMNQIWLAQKSKEGQQCFKEVWEQWQRGGRKVHEETVSSEKWRVNLSSWVFLFCRMLKDRLSNQSTIPGNEEFLYIFEQGGNVGKKPMCTSM